MAHTSFPIQLDKSASMNVLNITIPFAALTDASMRVINLNLDDTTSSEIAMEYSTLGAMGKGEKQRNVFRDLLRDDLPARKCNLVGWDGPNDPDNPRNWSLSKRVFVGLAVTLLEFSCYAGGAIYLSGIPSLIEEFGASKLEATLGFSLYIWAYGMGPMFLSPLQEIPLLGRNPVYIVCLFLFLLLNIPIVTARNMGTILAFRFLTGFVSSPATATGAATMADMFPRHRLPHAVGAWFVGGMFGPVVGPVIGNFAAQVNGWRWPIYELIWIGSFVLIFIVLFLPETLEANILLKRARRLRKLTGNHDLRSQSEIEHALLSGREVAYESLVRPFLLAAEPAVLFSNVYSGLFAGIYCLWFMAFPLVFGDIYHMNAGVGSLPFLCFIFSSAFAYFVYCQHLTHPRFQDPNLPPEARLQIGVLASIFIPISLFTFGWSSRNCIHWIVPTIAAALYIPGIFLMMQSIIMYISMSYPKYTGSVMAGNALFTSIMGGVFPLIGESYFRHLGIGQGSSLLAGISLVLLPVFYSLMKCGDRLRARSRYAKG